jgi:alpha-amylase
MRSSRWIPGLLAIALLGACRAAPPLPEPATTAAEPPTGAAPGWWPDRIFYEIFVRSFADATTGPLANDGIGDFQGLIEKLDYLNDGDPETITDLGITGIWLMPINPSPSYHGYDVTDYFGVHPQFGTRQDFERFLAEAHRRGIRVIVDLVLNHSSSQHPRFVQALRGEPASRDWYVFVPPSDVPTTLGPWGQQVWQEKQGQHYLGIFWAGMPDLNYRNPAVTAEAERIAAFWLREMNVDGFRLDAIRHLIEDGDVMTDTPETRAWLKRFQAKLRQIEPDVLTVGEVWASTEAVSEYIAEDALDLAFEFDLATAILDAARTGNKAKLAYTLDNVAASYPANRYATMITNHDQNRVASELGEDTPRLKLAAGLLLTAPGVPFVYYGEEIGQIGEKPDEMIRNPMPWSSAVHGGFTQAHRPWEPMQPGHATRNVAVQDADPASLLNHYRRLIRLRQSEPALSRGGFRSIETGREDVIAWERAAAGQRLIVVANLAGDTIRNFRVPGTEGDVIAGELLHAAPVEAGAADLAPHQLLVFTLR